MCLALYKPFNSFVDDEKLFYGFKNNDDGAGFIVSDGKKALGFKGFFTFNEFMDAYEPYNNDRFSTAVHFRYATHGKTNKKNCHPFRLTDDYLAIHNGVLPYKSCNDRSDTYYFCKEVLRPFCKTGDIETKEGQSLIEEYIETNKFVILRNDGTEIILNEKYGDWVQGVWYSNQSYMEDYYKPYINYNFAHTVDNWHDLVEEDYYSIKYADEFAELNDTLPLPIESEFDGFPDDDAIRVYKRNMRLSTRGSYLND